MVGIKPDTIIKTYYLNGSIVIMIIVNNNSLNGQYSRMLLLFNYNAERYINRNNPFVDYIVNIIQL